MQSSVLCPVTRCQTPSGTAVQLTHHCEHSSAQMMHCPLPGLACPALFPAVCCREVRRPRDCRPPPIPAGGNWEQDAGCLLDACQQRQQQRRACMSPVTLPNRCACQ
jgi:hypothetical protein